MGELKAKNMLQSLDIRSWAESGTRALNESSKKRNDCAVVESTPNEAVPDTTCKWRLLEDMSLSWDASDSGQWAIGSTI